MARPLKQPPYLKRNALVVRMDDVDFSYIKTVAEEMGVSYSEAVRILIRKNINDIMRDYGITKEQLLVVMEELGIKEF